MAYCTSCGTELDESTNQCPKCGAQAAAPATQPVEPASKPANPLKLKIKLHPFAIIAFVLSSMAFLYGFILTTTFFATGRGIAYTEYCAVVPSIVSIVFGLYCATTQSNKSSKIASAISVAASMITIFYAFIGYMVLAAG